MSSVLTGITDSCARLVTAPIGLLVGIAIGTTGVIWRRRRLGT